jgi:hypothetical protein
VGWVVFNISERYRLFKNTGVANHSTIPLHHYWMYDEDSRTGKVLGPLEAQCLLNAYLEGDDVGPD